MKQCINCTHGKKRVNQLPCRNCFNAEYWEPMTNSQRIRAMTDEEMAELIYRRHTCPPGKGYLDCKISDTCDKCWVDWLQQPVKEGAE